MVCIDAWDVRSKFPSGHYIRTLGAVGDRKVESEAILRQHDIRIDEFTTAVRSDLPAPDVPIVPEQHRLDLRDEVRSITLSRDIPSQVSRLIILLLFFNRISALSILLVVPISMMLFT